MHRSKNFWKLKTEQADKARDFEAARTIIESMDLNAFVADGLFNGNFYDLKKDKLLTNWPKPSPSCACFYPKETLIFANHLLNKIKPTGIRYKLSATNNKLSALQILFTEGVSSPIFKAKKEKGRDMNTVMFHEDDVFKKY